MANLTAKNVLKAGNTAVITGASSGIGRAAAIYCALNGMNVWMVDIDKEELKLAKELVVSKCKDAKTQKIESRVVDVSDAEAIEKLSGEVFDNNGKCNFLMNNAGMSGGSPGALKTDIKTFQRVMNVNLYGPIYGCLSFVPKMQASKEEGIIVNTGSKQGITKPPGTALCYNVSKSGLNAYTEGLEHELMKDRRENDGKLRAALLVPGWVNTSIALKSMRRKAKAEEKEFDASKVYFSEDKPAKGAWMPSQVIDYMVSYLDQSRFYILCPDNDVTKKEDQLKMNWTMGDIIEDRPPLSRWHPDYKSKYEAFMKEAKVLKTDKANKKIIIVVSSYVDMPQSEAEKKENKQPDKTGWYVPEVAHPYNLWKEQGYEMIFVSPKGGLANADESSVKEYAQDEECKKFTKEMMNKDSQIETIKISEIAEVEMYDAIFFAGGHGTMWDFPDNEAQNKAASAIYEAGGIVSAVCHGPAGLVNIKLSNGDYLVKGKTVTGFTNDEELAAGKTEVMPFRMETVLKDRGAKFQCTKNWGCNVEVSERLITGQNPASASALGQAVIDAFKQY